MWFTFSRNFLTLLTKSIASGDRKRLTDLVRGVKMPKDDVIKIQTIAPLPDSGGVLDIPPLEAREQIKGNS